MKDESIQAELQRLLMSGFDNLPAATDAVPSAVVHQPLTPEIDDQGREVLRTVAELMRNNDPYFHPCYLGQMLKPPHPVARAAYELALSINPNNHAYDGGRASSDMEKDCIAQLGAMIGWEHPLGHLCSGGTVANFEALWISRELRPNGCVIASELAHYTHQRLSKVLQVPYFSASVDEQGRICPRLLRQQLAQTDVATVVVTLGTTGMGTVDPLDEVLQLREEFGFRVHVDAAYGGYFKLARTLSPYVQRQYALLSEADSIVIDPHKHGLQPYGCGCVMFRDPGVAGIYHHDSPYTYFSSADLHLGEISLECSRAGAAAVALWATMKRFPLVETGEFAEGLSACHAAATQLYEWAQTSPNCVPLWEPQLDIVVWGMKGATASEASRRAQRLFDAAAAKNLFLALIQIDRKHWQGKPLVDEWDQNQVTCLRACLMKPEHHAWMPHILNRLEELMIANQHDA